MSNWRDVVGWEGVYEVSDGGETRSCDRRIKRSDGAYQTFSAKPLGQTLNDQGYLVVRLSAPGRRESARVHRLVAMAFIPNPLNLPEVNHLDGIKSNNAATNLEWTDSRGNRKHAWDTGLRTRKHLPIHRGEKNPAAKLKDYQIPEIRAKRRAGTTFIKLAAEYGVSKKVIMCCVSGESWSHIPMPLPAPPQEQGT